MSMSLLVLTHLPLLKLKSLSLGSKYMLVFDTSVSIFSSGGDLISGENETY